MKLMEGEEHGTSGGRPEPGCSCWEKTTKCEGGEIILVVCVDSCRERVYHRERQKPTADPKHKTIKMA